MLDSTFSKLIATTTTQVLNKLETPFNYIHFFLLRCSQRVNDCLSGLSASESRRSSTSKAYLPQCRVPADKAFQFLHCAWIFCPFPVSNKSFDHVHDKRYERLITCLIIRAVHVELTMSADSFIQSFRPFVEDALIPSSLTGPQCLWV